MYEEKKSPHLVEEPDLSGTYTAADYLQWKMEEMVELIRGKIFRMSPAPSSNHQSVSMRLSYLLEHFFQNKPCRTFAAPFDVYLVRAGEDYKKTKNIVEPDLCVICDPGKIKSFGCVGAPDLVIEIISPSSSEKDQKDKFELYEEYGVMEYWLVFPEIKSAVIYRLEKGKYVTTRPFTENEKVKSYLFPELEADLSDVFRNVTVD
ncbi:MAG TPA: Uma2 family endonuclease [Chitinophagales bacterium]|nr:Uma2 family endonuclease [Chitinophagales bacterium]